LFIVGFNIFITSVIMAFIKYLLLVPLRMTEEQLLIGDDSVHGEDAYAFGDARSRLYHDAERDAIIAAKPVDPINPSSDGEIQPVKE
jgi:hypothetical protein